MLNEDTLKAYADLQVQAIIFNMDVDIETWSLISKDNFKQPIWVQTWKDKQDDSDYNTYFDIDR